MGNQESFDHEENVVVLREKIKQMAISEARQEELVEWLKGGMSVTVERFQEKIDHLTAENERLRRERDNFLELAKEWMAIGHEKSTKQVFEWESRLLAAIEGEKNDK